MDSPNSGGDSGAAQSRSPVQAGKRFPCADSELGMMGDSNTVKYGFVTQELQGVYIYIFPRGIGTRRRFRNEEDMPSMIDHES